jgi:hypothetical protein
MLRRNRVSLEYQVSSMIHRYLNSLTPVIYPTLDPDLINTLMWTYKGVNYAPLVPTLPPWAKTVAVRNVYRQVTHNTHEFNLKMERTKVKEYFDPASYEALHGGSLTIGELKQLDPMTPELTVFLEDLERELIHRSELKNLAVSAERQFNLLFQRASEQEILQMFPLVSKLCRIPIERKRQVSEKRRQEIMGNLDSENPLIDLTDFAHLLAMLDFDAE